MDEEFQESQLLEQNLPSTSTQDNALSERFTTYEKLAGTTDLGRQYEQIVCGYYALTLALNDEVKNFEMTSNNSADGKFDDIGLKVTFTNGNSRRFLFQLKHKENKSINFADLISESKSNDFGVKKYFKSIREMNPDEDTVCILYTNCSTKIKGKIELTDEISFEQCNQMEFPDFFRNTKKGCENAVFEVKSESLKQKFYFATSQLNVKAVEGQINAKLKDLLKCDIHDAFTSYMRNWWSGKFLLTKHDIIAKISELALSPYLKNLTDEKCNGKTGRLKRAIMNFPLTIVKECEEDIIASIWESEESWIDEEFNKAKNKYGLKEHQRNTILWYLGKIPFVVKVDRSNEATVKSVMIFLRKDIKGKKIVLVGKISKTDFGQWQTLGSLCDILRNSEDNQDYSYIMQKFHISFQGRGSIPLESLLKIDQDVAGLIGARELLKMTQQEHLLVGNQKEALPDLHIPRLIFSNTSQDPTKAVKETEIFKHFQTPLHLICAPPGMGKSTLMKVLYNSCPSDCLAVHVSLINHYSFLSTEPSFETILNHFLGIRATKNDLFQKLKKHFWQKRKLHMFLDGLDEVNSQHVECILNFVKQASVKGVNVWISSRENLRGKIHQALDVVPINIKELGKEEQQEYIYNKLKINYAREEIGRITLAIFSSTDLNNSQNLLGIPLQLHIITEMFLNDPQVYENLEKKSLFILTQMYKIFFEGKIKFATKKVVAGNQQLLLGYVKYVLQAYEILALKACLSFRDYKKLNLSALEDEDFLQQLKTEGDIYGIVKTVTANDKVIFSHQTYAEYFVAAWFRKNKDKIQLLQDRIFSSEYENLRLLFDVMLAEHNPLHLAIIYQDIGLFENQIGDIDCRDEGGRTAFHVAFSYGQKYKFTFNRLKVTQRETSCYMTMVERLLKEGKLPEGKDDLFGVDCVSYAFKSRCLYPIEKILEKKLLNFRELKMQLCNYYAVDAVVSHSARFGYPNLLSGFINRCQDLLIGLITVAIIGCEFDDTLTTKGNVEVVRILIENLPGANLVGTRLLDRACILKRFNMLEILIKNGAKCHIFNWKTILHILVDNCSEKYHQEIVTTIKKFDICVNARDYTGATALHIAAKSADPKILEVLIETGADLNLPDYDGQNALHYATRKFRSDVMELLLNKGININAQDDTGKAPLYLACQEGKPEIVKFLLNHGADPKLPDNRKNNALHYASWSEGENSDTVSLLIDEGLSVNEQNEDGLTPLHLACRRGDSRRAETLLELGADPNVPDKNGDNALHQVMMATYMILVRNRNLKDLVELLIKKGVDVNAQNHEGATPLHKAAFWTDLESVEALEENGADLNILDYKGQSVVHYSSKNYRRNVIESFLSRGISANAQDANGVAPIHLASEAGRNEIVEILLEQGANPKIVDNEENNALHYASKNGTRDTIELLVSRGLDVNAKNQDGVAPIHSAYLSDNLFDIDFLLHKGAKEDVNAKFNNGETLLHLVCKSGASTVPIVLLNRGLDPNRVDTAKRNALHYHLMKFYDKELVHQMINHGLNLNTLYGDGQTLLHIACLHSDTRNVKKLVKELVDVNVLNENGQSPLQVVVKSLQKVKGFVFKFLDSIRYNRNNMPEHGHEFESYKFGCEGCYAQLLRNLRQYRGFANFEDYIEQKFSRVVGRNERIVIFLQHIKNVNSETHFKKTACCIVARFIIFEMVNYLLKNGSLVNELDNFNKTAIDYASEWQDEFPEIISRLRHEEDLQERPAFSWRLR